MKPSLRALTIGFLGAFLVATAGTGIATYLFTLDTIDRLVDRRLDTVSYLVGGTGGRASVAPMLARIATYSNRRDTGDIGFVLSDASGKRIGGNVPLPQPLVAGFSGVDATDGITGLSAGRAYVRRIGPDLFLTTIAETEPFDGYQAHRLRTFLIGFGSIVVIVLAGVTAFAMTIARRFAETRHTVEAIIAGDMQRRVVVTGSADEFDRHALAFNRMLDRIGELMDGLRNVSNDVAHDLRMPLAGLRSRLATIAVQSTDDAQRQAVEEATDQCDRILAMITAMLRIAEVEAGKRVAGFAAIDLVELIDDILEMMAPVAADDGRELRTAPLAPITLAGDRQLLSQAMVNLIENALRHTPPGTIVTLSLTRMDNVAVIAIADNGPGIPPDQRPLALRRFGRLEASRTRPGHGLGLPLVAAIARLHGGELLLEDAGPGLRGVLRLPLA